MTCYWNFLLCQAFFIWLDQFQRFDSFKSSFFLCFHHLLYFHIIIICRNNTFYSNFMHDVIHAIMQYALQFKFLNSKLNSKLYTYPKAGQNFMQLLFQFISNVCMYIFSKINWWSIYLRPSHYIFNKAKIAKILFKKRIFFYVLTEHKLWIESSYCRIYIRECIIYEILHFFQFIFFILFNFYFAF